MRSGDMGRGGAWASLWRPWGGFMTFVCRTNRRTTRIHSGRFCSTFTSTAWPLYSLWSGVSLLRWVRYRYCVLNSWPQFMDLLTQILACRCERMQAWGPRPSSSTAWRRGTSGPTSSSLSSRASTPGVQYGRYSRVADINLLEDDCLACIVQNIHLA